MTRFGRNILKQIPTVFFEWQDTERASLLCLLVICELMLQWTWLGTTYLFRNDVKDFFAIEYIIPVWIGCSLTIAFFVFLTLRFKKIKNYPKLFYYYQILLVTVYMIYNDIAIMLIEQELLISGAAFVGSTIVGLLLIDRRIVWWSFIIQCSYSILFILLSTYTLDLPSLRRLPEYFDLVSYNSELVYQGANDYFYMNQKGELYQKSIVEASHLYWRASYIYLLMPKAIAIVYLVKVLLEIIDDGHEVISHKATHDELTGLLNKSSVFAALREQTLSEDNVDDLSVVVIDLDHFKSINDKYGHGVGDVVLQKAATLFQKHVPPSSMLGRYGGEEFLLILPNCTQGQAVDIANELRTALNDFTFKIEGHDIQISSSFGIASICLNCLHKIQESKVDQKLEHFMSKPVKADDILIKQVIKNADDALYQAKYHGRNRVMRGVSINCLASTLKNSTIEIE